MKGTTLVLAFHAVALAVLCSTATVVSAWTIPSTSSIPGVALRTQTTKLSSSGVRQRFPSWSSRVSTTTPLFCQHRPNRETPYKINRNLPSRRATSLAATKIPGDSTADGPELLSTTTTTTPTLSILAMKLYAGVSIFYWYWLVLGAVGQANGWPGIPHWIPSTPAFPPSDAELQSILDDSAHFLYLSDVWNGGNADSSILPDVPAWRLAFFNTVEAWVIAFLPLLWKDQRRWPRPVLFLYWSVGCVFLTNAFLAPYLLITKFSTPKRTSETTANATPGKNPIVSGALAAFTSAVVLYGLSTIGAGADSTDVFASLQSAATSWWEAAQEDRSNLAYGTDLAIFSFFQPMLLGRVRNDMGQSSQKASDFIPFVGLILWLLLEKDVDAKEG